MIHLRVTLDSILVQHLRDGGRSGMEAAWTGFCRQNSIANLSGFGDFFQCDQEPTLNELLLLSDTVSFVDSNLRQSIEHITRWLPEVDEDLCQSMTVGFLPYGKYTFSPKLGLQLFSLHP